MPAIDSIYTTINSIPLVEQTVSPPTPPAGKKTVFAKSDGLYLVDDEGVVTGPMAVSAGSIPASWKYPADGRLTLETGVPVSTTDQLAKTTLYYTPYIGDQIALYSGTSWETVSFTELSLSLSGYTANMPYDIWIYNNAGTATLESTIWSNTTTRATNLIRQNGILCKTGALTRRYLGTICITIVTGQCEDSLLKRFVWNYYNPLSRKLKVVDITSYWTYMVATWRSANNSIANRVEAVIGVSDNPLKLIVGCASHNSGGNGRAVGIGVDTTSSNSSDLIFGTFAAGSWVTAQLNYVGIGYHYYQWVEISEAVGTTYWYGILNAVFGSPQSGMVGEVLG